MSSNEFTQDGLTQQYCVEHGVLIATMWYYRFSMFFSLVISTASAFHMIYFIHRCYGTSVFFHPNLRVIFISLCLCCFAYDLLNIVMKAHHLALSYLYAAPCDIFLSKALYIILHLPTFFVVIAAQFIQFSMMVERWIATVFVSNNYESRFRKIGPELVAAAVLTTACVLFAMYHDESFNEAHLNARWLAAIKDAARANVTLLSLVIVNFIGLVLTITLRYVNPKREIGMSLSSKFQANEISIVSSYLFWISVSQFTVLTLSQAILLYLRIYEAQNPLLIAYKENADLFNYYTLALPILSMVYLRKVKRQRAVSIRRNISIKTVGTDGWTNYAAVIQKQWN